MRSVRALCLLVVLVGLTFGLTGAGAVEFQVGNWSNPFLPHIDDATGWTPTPFNPGGSLGQTFETNWPMAGVRIKSPSWSGTGAGFKMAVYTWNTDYATSLVGPALGVATFTNYADNGFQEMFLNSSVPAGQYLLHTYDPVWGATTEAAPGTPGHWGWSNLTDTFANPVPAAYKDGVIMDGNLFRMDWILGLDRNFTTVEPFFTEGTTVPVPLTAYPKIGQRFTATQPFDGVEVNTPAWSTNGVKGYTLRLYNWADTYEATVAQTPLATNVYTGIFDNFWYPVVSATTLPPGVYFWEMSEPTSTSENFDVGMWMVSNSEYADGEAYYNGVAQPSNATTPVYPFDNNGSSAAIQFGSFSSMGITFETPAPILQVGIVSPSWSGTGAGYRMSLYAWNTDYSTTVGGTPVVQQTFTNYPDNATNIIDIPGGTPAGQYLLLTDQPVWGISPETGVPGHWGYTGSSLITGADVPNTYYDGYKQTDYPEQFNKTTFRVYYLLDKMTGPDFKSRSVLKPTSVMDWNQY